MKTIAPRTSGIFKRNLIKRIGYFGRILIEGLTFGQLSFSMLSKLKEMGAYNIFGGAAIAPFDLMSFIFRTMGGLAKDMMKKQTQEQLIEVCERMEPYMTSVFSLLPKSSGYKGIWFVTERAFSLSPRQFERFYWPTLKKIIVSLAKDGNTPFLVWEQDVTHLVHFLLELPKNISRKCVFLCDTSDIFEVNKILDGHICIQGNIPLSTMCVGTPKDVEKYCAKLFKELKPGGGFMLSPALGIPDEAKPENVHAYINYAEKHGWY
jgi:uroporphyrinogen-III decarboxylase